MSITKNSFYITTTLPYVNAEPHIGFASEIVRADIIARSKRMLGHDVFFNTGTDEHGVKVYRKALEANLPPQEYVDAYAQKFVHLHTILNLSYNSFIRTTEPRHIDAAQEFWTRCFDNGDIYKKNYQIKYCVGCELEKTESELAGGKCPIHPNLEVEVLDEENYFFKFSKYQEKLLEFYGKHADFVIPEGRYREIKAFVERGLQDFSISRLAEKMPWGVPVPNDSAHVMYVWFDALVNYISAIGWPHHTDTFEMWWPVVQYAGKDNLRQQSAMWQAMLMSAGIPNSKQIVINGFVTSGGVKMSKSLGNVVYPAQIVAEYGTDALRYYIAREMSPFEDSDFTADKFKEAYNANLANGIGNLTSRIIKLTSTYNVRLADAEIDVFESGESSEVDFFNHLEHYEINKACDVIWHRIQILDATIQEKQPFKLIKTDEDAAKKILHKLLSDLYSIGKMLEPILPETSLKIRQAIKFNVMPEKSLFPRKD